MRKLERAIGSRIERRRAAWDRGRKAELVVAAYLKAHGAVVLGSNVRVGRLEIDVLARDGDVVLVVEVRNRGVGSFQTAFASIGPDKARRVRAAGEILWRTRFSSDRRVNHMRFDVASVTFGNDGAPRVEYARGVF